MSTNGTSTISRTRVSPTDARALERDVISRARCDASIHDANAQTPVEHRLEYARRESVTQIEWRGSRLERVRNIRELTASYLNSMCERSIWVVAVPRATIVA